DDAAPVDDDRRRSRHVLALVAAACVDETVAPRHREVAIGQEPVARAKPLGELLALLVRIGADHENLNALVTQLGQHSSKSLELGDAEGSPGAAVEDDDDRRTVAKGRE